MGTHVEPFPARTPSARAWIAVGAVVLLLAALGAGTLIGRATVEEPAPPKAATEGLASADMTARIDAVLEAASGGGAEELAKVYAEDAIFVYRIESDPGSRLEPQMRVGLDDIVEAMEGANMYGDFAIERVGPVIGRGDYGAAYVIFHGAGGWEGTYGVAVYRFDADGKVAAHFAISN